LLKKRAKSLCKREVSDKKASERRCGIKTIRLQIKFAFKFATSSVCSHAMQAGMSLLKRKEEERARDANCRQREHPPPPPHTHIQSCCICKKEKEITQGNGTLNGIPMLWRFSCSRDDINMPLTPSLEAARARE